MRRTALFTALFAVALLVSAEDIQGRKKGPSHENKQLNYRITGPDPRWTKLAKPMGPSDCTFMAGADLCLMVVALETPQPLDTKEMAEAVRVGMKATASEVKEVSTTPCRLAGEDGVRLLTDASVGKFNFTYVHFLVCHEGIFYQVVSWGTPATVTREMPQVEAFARSLRFLGLRTKWVEAHRPRAWTCAGNGVDASVSVDGAWTAAPGEDGAEGVLFLTDPALNLHLYLNVAETQVAPEAWRDDAEGRLRGWLQGYSTITRGKGKLDGVEAFTIEGRGKLDNVDTHVVSAACTDGGHGVIVIGAWPEAVGESGRKSIEEALQTLRLARETAVPLPVPASARKKTASEQALSAKQTRGLEKSEAVLLLPPQSRLSAFAPSPDGKAIAAVIDGVLHLAALPKGEQRPVSTAAAAVTVTWSADGKRLWFATEGREVWTCDASGARARRLPVDGVAASPGPDGRILVVQPESVPSPLTDWWLSSGGQRLVSVREDGTDPRTLAGTRLMPLSGPEWHPGRRALLFVDGDAGAWRGFHGSLRTLGEDGKELAKGVVPEATVGRAMWLPASGRVLCTRTKDPSGGERAVVVDLDERTETPLAIENPSAGLAVDGADRVYFPAWWRPDGEVGTTVYRRTVDELAEDARKGGVPEPLDDAALAALDRALEPLLPDMPGPARLTPEKLSRAAEVVAEALGPHVPDGLRFQPDSGEALADLLSAANGLFGKHPRAVLGVGAYVAEVLRRHAGAEWVLGDGAVDFRWDEDLESPIVGVRYPLTEVWRLLAYPDEAYFALSPDQVKEWSDGRRLLLACSAQAAGEATGKADGEDLGEAHAAWKRFEPEASIEAYGRAIARHPKSGPLRKEAASRAYAAGRLDLAAKWAEEWTSLETDDPAAWTFLGTLVIATDPPRAIEWLSKAIELAEESSAPALFLRLGHAYLAAGDTKAARACFRKAAEQSYGVGPEAKRMLESLKERK